MKESIFDSKSEKSIFKRLKTCWSKYVDVFPQIPLKNVVGYDEIVKFSKSKKVEDFLMKTSFDFVICELETGLPILVVEFDGLGGGFSQEGNFYIKSIPEIDPHRKLKMETKLSLCTEFQVPMIVMSYDESNLLQESGDWISVLDVIIGDSIEKRFHRKNYSKYIEMLTEAYEFGGQESAELTSIEIEIINEQHNPVKQKIKGITKKFPMWPMQIVFPKEQGDWLTGRFTLNWGLNTLNGFLHTKKLLDLDLKIRKVGVFDSDSLFLFNTIGEYCLARKTEREIGIDKGKWQELIDKTEWTK